MSTLPDAAASRDRRRLLVRGIVQGVGFRPFVHRLATHGGLGGFVRNDGGGVTIEIEGSAAALDYFERALREQMPPRARIDAIERQPQAVQGGSEFAIADSAGGAVATAIGADSAVCADCLDELFTPSDRRWRYPFINCTHCGPRYTITRALPYDRAQTSMAAFALCPACTDEYRDPGDRRFHAEPNACPRCGPQLWVQDRDGRRDDGDAIAATLRRLRAGEIVAIKGLGGFHLVCDARNAASVAALRARKSRGAKPLAIMAANVASLASLLKLDAASTALLIGAERPIVLLSKRDIAEHELAGVAPGLAEIGAMLPYTPLHYLLFHEAAGRPAGRAWLEQAQPLLLVMTSANPGGEPLVRDNDEAVVRLAQIADAFVMHDRDIVVRCDDSVLSVHGAGARFARRARGYAPLAIALSRATPPVLALGGGYKNTACLTRGAEAFVSQHIGDLDNAASCRGLDEAVAHLQAIVAVRPAVIVHDRHPDFYASRLAAQLAATLGVPSLAVQHHHAHIAAVLAEHRIEAPVLGLALDGVGLGDDGAAWGGELLQVDGARSLRLGHLRPLALPGGDRAAREPWRMAASALQALGRGEQIAKRFGDEPAAATLAQMLVRGVRAPMTSSLGRVFDAAAGLLGVCRRADYEGQAAMQLEALASRTPAPASTAGCWTLGSDGTLDLRPLLALLADETDAARGAALLHAALADALADWLAAAAETTGLRLVAGGGGCFLNRVLCRRLQQRLDQRGLRLLQAEQLPPNDGGLALGQAWVAQRAMF